MAAEKRITQQENNRFLVKEPKGIDDIAITEFSGVPEEGKRGAGKKEN